MYPGRQLIKFRALRKRRKKKGLSYKIRKQGCWVQSKNKLDNRNSDCNQLEYVNRILYRANGCLYKKVVKIFSCLIFSKKGGSECADEANIKLPD